MELSDLPSGWRLAEHLPSLDAMVYEDRYYYATCPYCGRRLAVYAHGDRAAFECFKCQVVWPTPCAITTMGHRVLLKAILENQTRKRRRPAGEGKRYYPPKSEAAKANQRRRNREYYWRQKARKRAEGEAA